MAQTLVAGVDCSTQATKVVIVEPDSGAVVATGRASHDVTGEGGARETHPAQWWEALQTAMRQTGCAGEVGAISVGGQQHGLVVTDATGEPLRPAVLWNDTRSAPDARRLTEAFGGPKRWADEIGSVPVASYTATSWAWLRRVEPDVADAARGVCLPHDWLNGRLTGRAATDRGDASGTAWWSTRTGEYSSEVLGLDALRLDAALLPPVLGPAEPAGEVTSAGAEWLGLSAGVLVGPGTGDNMAAAVGLGVDRGVPVLSLGTSGTVYAVSERRPDDATGLVSGFADATGRFLPLACTLNCTLAVDRVAAWLRVDREAVAERTDAVVLPYFDGERTPDLPNAAATLTGLRHETTPEQILLAAYEGAVASLLEALDRVGEQAGGLAPDAPLVLIGGGARGAAWRSVVGRLSGRALQIPAATELVALGAAAQAAAALTGEAPEAVTRRWDTLAGETLDPVARDADALDRVRRVREATETLNA